MYLVSPVAHAKPRASDQPDTQQRESDTLWANSGRDNYANNASAKTLTLVKYIVYIRDSADIDATLPVTSGG